MKILKSSLSIALLVLFLSNTSFGSSNISQSTTDQDTLKSYIPAAGKRAIAINVNPIFNYLGNMFNGSTGNSLDISAANVLFRKFKENNIVKRYRLSIGVSTEESSLVGSITTYPYGLNSGTSRSINTSLSFAYGKERRYNYKKLSLYTGWELLSGISHSSNSYNYEINEGDVFTGGSVWIIDFTRRKSSTTSSNLTVGAAGILGADYYFSKMFFAAIELSVPLVFTVRRIESEKEETASVTSPDKIIKIVEEESEDPRYLISGSVSSTNLIQFRAGIVF